MDKEYCAFSVELSAFLVARSTSTLKASPPAIPARSPATFTNCSLIRACTPHIGTTPQVRTSPSRPSPSSVLHKAFASLDDKNAHGPHWDRSAGVVGIPETPGDSGRDQRACQARWWWGANRGRWEREKSAE